MARRRFTPRPPRLLPRNTFRPRRSRMRSGPLVVGVLLVGGIAAMVSGNGSSPSIRTASPAVSTAMAASSPGEQRVSFRMCSSNRYTCVVDGDTIWLEGQNLRLESYDTPEPYNDICGGQAEVALAHRASAWLLELLNGNSFTVETHGADRYGRTLATIKIGGRDVGDILISEGLARRWPNGREFWC